MKQIERKYRSVDPLEKVLSNVWSNASISRNDRQAIVLEVEIITHKLNLLQYYSSLKIIIIMLHSFANELLND